MRRFEFVVDRHHAQAVNEVVAESRRFAVAAVISAGCALAVTVGLLWLGHPWSYLLALASALGAVIALWVALWAPRRWRIDRLYADGELVPAVVSHQDAHGIMLLALVRVDRPGAAVRYALVIRQVRALPGHVLRAGERVPAVAVREDRTARAVRTLGQPVSAMPIAWGTRDPQVIARATAAISEVEWRLLVDNLALTEKVRSSTAQRLLLDPHHLPSDLRTDSDDLG